jgi:integrase
MVRKRMSKKTGVVSYQAIAKVKGYPDQVKSFRTKREAEAWEVKTKAAMHAGTFRDDKPVRDKTLSDAIDRYMGDSFFKKKKNWKTIRGHLLYWKEALGKYALPYVTPDLVAKRRDELAKEITVRNRVRSSASVNRYMASLSSVFKVANEEWGWISDTPVRSVRKLKEPRGRIRFLSDTERGVLLKSCKESNSVHLYRVVMIALATGMRRGEILNLKWGDVDLDTGKMVIRESKNGEVRVVYVTELALQELRKHAQEHMFQTQWVFPNKNVNGPASISHSWNMAVNRAGIDNFKFHDLRHTAASYLAMNGASLAEIAEILGHKTLAMVKRYAHFCESHSKKVLQSMNEKVFSREAS